jgi:hypothetical protein
MQEDLAAGELVESLRAEFRKHGALTQGQVRKFCERKVKDFRMIGQALDQLVLCGDIVKLGFSGGPGRPTDKWEWVKRGSRK